VRTEAFDGLIPPTTQAVRRATKWHDGQINKTCPALRAKIFRWPRRANQI
jgi:hypothetical protein